MNQVGDITISITNRCNYLCTHCSFDSGERRISECTAEEWKRFLQEARSCGARKIDIGGGEPTLREDLPEIITLAHGLGYHVKLLTNGSLLNKERLDKLKESKLEAIAVSLDGSNSDIHNAIRKKDEEEFRKTIESIRRAKDYGFFVKINSVVVNKNLEDLPNLISLCLDLGADEHRLCYFTPTGRGARNPDGVAPEKWLAFIRSKFTQFQRFSSIYVGVPFIENNRTLETCCWLNERIFPLHVLPNGDIYACSIRTATDHPLGNIKQTGIREIFEKQPKIEGCCFDYSPYFGTTSKNMKYVCPLRKFKLPEVL